MTTYLIVSKMKLP